MHWPDPLRSALACPRCRADLEDHSDAFRCEVCGQRFPEVHGVLDFAPDEKQPGVAQRLMESRLVASVYEERFRPAMTRLVSPITYDEEAAYLRRFFRPAEGPVLDLACGTGRYARLLAELAGAHRVIGLDLSPGMLRVAARGSRSLHFVRGSALALPFHDGALGAVNCSMALHLFPDPGRALREVGRVLGSGGSFTCVTVSASGLPVMQPVEEAMGRIASLRFFDEVALLREIEAAGLRVQDVTRQRQAISIATRRE